MFEQLLLGMTMLMLVAVLSSSGGTGGAVLAQVFFMRLPGTSRGRCEKEMMERSSRHHPPRPLSEMAKFANLQLRWAISVGQRFLPTSPPLVGDLLGETSLARREESCRTACTVLRRTAALLRAAGSTHTGVLFRWCLCYRFGHSCGGPRPGALAAWGWPRWVLLHRRGCRPAEVEAGPGDIRPSDLFLVRLDLMRCAAVLEREDELLGLWGSPPAR